jgi:hypothetical protein
LRRTKEESKSFTMRSNLCLIASSPGGSGNDFVVVAFVTSASYLPPSSPPPPDESRPLEYATLTTPRSYIEAQTLSVGSPAVAGSGRERRRRTAKEAAAEGGEQCQNGVWCVLYRTLLGKASEIWEVGRK